MKSLRWLYPGMGIKRWILLILLGALLVTAGIVLLLELRLVDVLGEAIKLFYILTGQLLPTKWAGVGLIFIGVLLSLLALQRAIRSIVMNISIPGKSSLVDIIFQKRFLSAGPKVVTIGGGTGVSTILRGLKEYTSNITAIVTVTDDGGSSGRLRREFDIPPPGDIRNCVFALADCEEVLRDLFQYRFSKGEGLKGHSLGNLLLTAMTDITGDFERGLAKISEVFAVRGKVLPSTSNIVVLQAEMEDGEILEGESRIRTSPKRIKRIWLHPSSTLSEEAKEAIEEADLIVIGPGSLYTSVLSTLLVEGMVEALDRSKGKKVFICNLMTEKGETDGFTASDHVRVIKEHLGKMPFKYVVVNTQRPSEEVLNAYKAEGAEFVELDWEELRKMGLLPIARPLIANGLPLRHNAFALAKVLFSLL